MTPLNAYRYAGKRLDAGSATLDMGARRFGPDISHFLQQDYFKDAFSDLGLAQDPLTQNRYDLAGGNPLSFIETGGHSFTNDGAGGSGRIPSLNAPPEIKPGFVGGVSGGGSGPLTISQGLWARCMYQMSGDALCPDASGKLTLTPQQYQHGANIFGQAGGAINTFGNTHTIGVCINVGVGIVLGATASGCFAGNLHSIGFTGTVGGEQVGDPPTQIAAREAWIVDVVQSQRCSRSPPSFAVEVDSGTI